MITTKLKFAAPALMLAALLPTTGCKSTEEKEKGKSTTEVTTTEGGGQSRTAQTTYTTSATITGIDAPNRRVTLTKPDGMRHTYTLGPEVQNFDQLRIGDKVNTTLTEEVAVSLKKGGTPGSSEGTVITRAPKGGTPGAVMTTTRQITGKIIAIQDRHVTLQFADGTSSTVTVRDDVKMTGVAPGDTVTAKVTDAMAITVTKP